LLGGAVSLKGVKVGDPVWVSLWGGAYEKRQVEKVGRKYLHVYAHQFDIHTGRLAGRYSGQCRTEAQHEEEEARLALVWQLNALSGQYWRTMSTDQLTRMLAIAKEPKP
jgi:hypothetical protein